MGRMIGLTIALLPVVCAGCATMYPAPPPPAPRQAVFNEAEYAPFGEPGTGSIAGQAFLKTRSGDVKLCAGEQVILNPQTSYSTEWFNVSILQERAIATGDPRAQQFTRFAIADGDGRFRFAGLPSGDYYLVCRVTWEVPSAYGGGLTTTGGPAYATATVRENVTTEVVLTDHGWTGVPGPEAAPSTIGPASEIAPVIQAGSYVTVGASGGRVYSLPSERSELILTLPAGDRFRVAGKANPSWLIIELDRGRRGYVHVSDLQG